MTVPIPYTEHNKIVTTTTQKQLDVCERKNPGEIPLPTSKPHNRYGDVYGYKNISFSGRFDSLG